MCERGDPGAPHLKYRYSTNDTDDQSNFNVTRTEVHVKAAPEHFFFVSFFLVENLLAHTRCCCLSITVTLLLDRSHSFIDLAGLSVSLVYPLFIGLAGLSHTLVVVVVLSITVTLLFIGLLVYRSSPVVLYPSTCSLSPSTTYNGDKRSPFPCSL